MSSQPLNFHLEHYEGPLDLLLDLIRKQQIDIRDIPIASMNAPKTDFTVIVPAQIRPMRVRTLIITPWKVHRRL